MNMSAYHNQASNIYIYIYIYIHIGNIHYIIVKLS